MWTQGTVEFIHLSSRENGITVKRDFLVIPKTLRCPLRLEILCFLLKPFVFPQLLDFSYLRLSSCLQITQLVFVPLLRELFLCSFLPTTAPCWCILTTLEITLPNCFWKRSFGFWYFRPSFRITSQFLPGVQDWLWNVLFSGKVKFFHFVDLFFPLLFFHILVLTWHFRSHNWYYIRMEAEMMEHFFPKVPAAFRPSRPWRKWTIL